jgi:RNA polymerase sigma-70 factor (ECF subfamily)
VTESPIEPDQPTPDDPIFDRARIELVYQEYAVSLKRFLLGVLKDDAATGDALQATFIKLMEKGHLIEQESSIKSWLFRVAFNEAMLVKRRNATKRKHAESVAIHWQSRRGDAGDGPLGPAIEQITRQEDIELVRAALDELSDVQRQVLKCRIYEDKKFREIADELDVPLGTVLARMQSALKKLKPILAARLDSDQYR